MKFDYDFSDQADVLAFQKLAEHFARTAAEPIPDKTLKEIDPAMIAELAHLKNLVHGGNRRIKEETKANWRNLNPDVPESYRLHEAENEIMGLEDALIVKKVEVVELSQRIAALEEALRAVIEGNDLAAERGHSIESWPGSSVRKEARAGRG